jgi:hypothetical protein
MNLDGAELNPGLPRDVDAAPDFAATLAEVSYNESELLAERILRTSLLAGSPTTNAPREIT